MKKFLLLFLLLCCPVPCVAGVLTACPLNSWCEIPNSDLNRARPIPTPLGNGFQELIQGWNGGAYDTRRDRLLIWGGGHTSYAGNEIYALDLDDVEAGTTRLYEAGTPTPHLRIAYDTNLFSHSGGPIGVPSALSCTDPLSRVYPAGVYGDAGSPSSRHTYDGIEYLHGTDEFLIVGGSKNCAAGDFAQDTWTYSFTTNKWVERATSLPSGGGHPGYFSGYDPQTGIYYLGGDSSGDAFLAYNRAAGANGTWEIRSAQLIGLGHLNAAVDPDNGVFIAFGDGQQHFAYLTPTGNTLTLNTFTANATNFTLSEVTNGNKPGFDYDRARKKFVAWAGGDSIYELTVTCDRTISPTASNKCTGSWTKSTPSGGSTIPALDAGYQGTFGRWRYSHKYGGFITCFAVNQNCWFYRAPSGSGRLSMTANTWIPHSTADIPAGLGSPNKHVRLTYDSRRGKIWMTGGDYPANSYTGGAYPTGNREASHEEIWSYTPRTDTWTLELNWDNAQASGMPRGLCLANWNYDRFWDGLWMYGGEERYSTYTAGLASNKLQFFNPTQTGYIWSQEGPDIDYDEGSILNVVETQYGWVDLWTGNLVTGSAQAGTEKFFSYNWKPITLNDGTQNDNWSAGSSLTGLGMSSEPLFPSIPFATDWHRRAIYFLNTCTGGGSCISRVTRVYRYNIDSNTITELGSSVTTATMPLKHIYGLVHDPVNDVLVAVAGYNSNEGDPDIEEAYLNGTYYFRLNDNTWHPAAITGTVPTPRKGENLVYDPDTEAMYFFGGTGGFQSSGVADVNGHFGDEMWALRLDFEAEPPPSTSVLLQGIQTRGATIR